MSLRNLSSSSRLNKMCLRARFGLSRPRSIKRYTLGFDIRRNAHASSTLKPSGSGGSDLDLDFAAGDDSFFIVNFHFGLRRFAFPSPVGFLGTRPKRKKPWASSSWFVPPPRPLITSCRRVVRCYSLKRISGCNRNFAVTEKIFRVVLGQRTIKQNDSSANVGSRDQGKSP